MHFCPVSRFLRPAARGAFLTIVLAAMAVSGQVTLDIGNATAPSGGTADVLVELQNSGGEIAVVVFFLEFDSALVTVTNVQPGPDAPAGFVAQFMPNPNDPSVGVTLFGPGNVALPDGDIMRVTFDVASLPEGTVIPITGSDSSVATVDDPPQEIPSVVRPGAITIGMITPPPNCGSKTPEPKALPEADPATGLRFVALDAPIYVLLEHPNGIAPESVWAEVTTPSGTETSVALNPLVSTDFTNVWAVVTPDEAWIDGDWITVTAGATGQDGAKVGPVMATFMASTEGSVASPGGPNRVATTLPGDMLLYAALVALLLLVGTTRRRPCGQIR